MSDTTFIAGTVIAADWLNDVNDATYTKLTNVGTISVAAATVLDDASVGAMLTTMGGAPLASPTFTGTPTLPTGTIAVTQAAADSSTKIATTAFVQQEVPAASTTIAGKAELLTSAELRTGTDTTRIPTADAIYSALGFTSYFQSSAQTITVAGALTLAHSLGRYPVFITVELRCVTGELGYTAGDRVAFSPSGDLNGTSSGLSITYDATNLNVRFGAAAFALTNKTTGSAGSTITPASWTIVFRAWG